MHSPRGIALAFRFAAAGAVAACRVTYCVTVN